MAISKIRIQLKTVYGRELIYPICEKAKLLVKLLKRKTFTEEDIPVIQALGYTIEIVSDAA